jgi:hypothetical protein
MPALALARSVTVLKGHIPGPFTVRGNDIFTSVDEGDVSRFDVATGRLMWKTPSECFGVVCLVDDVLLTADASWTELRAIDRIG